MQNKLHNSTIKLCSIIL